MNRAYGAAFAVMLRVSSLALVPAAGAWAEDFLDPIQQAVVDSLETSLALPGGGTPAGLLEAAIKAADVDAVDASARYLARLAAVIDAAGA
ncbi:MAG: hypothetical protein FJ284_02370, partial [Planctomycetes bacterium]|nr:hypothetical protein [Planctomycetota bacterium]